MSSFLRTMKGNQAEKRADLKKWIHTLDKKEKDKAEGLLSVMMSGKFIMMLGSFCPLFWRSLLSGDRISVVLFNLVHSVLYIMLGYIMIKKSKKSLDAMRKKHKGGAL